MVVFNACFLSGTVKLKEKNQRNLWGYDDNIEKDRGREEKRSISKDEENKMNNYENRRLNYLAWELVLIILIVWMGMQINTYKTDNSSYTGMVITENGPEDEIAVKLSMFVEFVKKHKSTDPDLDRKYVNKGLIYLSGVLNAMIQNHYQNNTGMKVQREKLLNINLKILNTDSLTAENLKASLLTASKIIARIQSYEFPDLSDASKNLINSVMEIEQDETFDILKFRTADFFEKSSNIFIAMAIINAHRNNEIRNDFYNIRSS